MPIPIETIPICYELNDRVFQTELHIKDGDFPLPQIAQLSGISHPELETIVASIKEVSPDEKITIEDVIPDPNSMEEHVEQQSLLAYINKYIERLDPLERDVLRFRYTENLTYEQIGNRLGFTGENVRKIGNRTMDRIRNWISRMEEYKEQFGNLIGSSRLRTWKNAVCGISTLPTSFIRSFPFFCFLSNLSLRVLSPP
jgi:hypothetical protein